MAQSAKSRVADLLMSAATDARKATERLELLRANARMVESVLKQCPRGVYLSLWGYGSTVSISYTIRIKGFKTAKLARELEKWLGEATAMSSHESPEYGYRIYEFTIPRGALTFKISVEARLMAEARACQSVQIGEEVEVVRRPIYEFQCK